jgi:hypothetical protein
LARNLNLGGLIVKKLIGCLCALTLSFAIAGCGGSGTDQAKTEEHGDQTAATAETAPATTETAGSATASGTPVTLTGTTGCGHCTFGVVKECAAAMKTASGEVYMIDGVVPDSDLWKAREESKNIQLTGSVWKSEADNLSHVKMESYQLN